MLLGIRTDSPVAEFVLCTNKGIVVASSTWEANRQLAHQLLGYIDHFLAENNYKIDDLTGLFVFEGPGSFTGIRIGITVINTLAYGLGVPVVGSHGDDWQAVAIKSLLAGDDDKSVTPNYGSDTRITLPKK